MPTVLHVAGLLLFLFARQAHEPRHVPGEHGDKLAKSWLEPVELASSSRYRLA
jgi:hypothetical protein